MSKSIVIGFSVWLCLLLVSLVFFLAPGQALQKRVLVFPDIRSGNAIREYRFVPARTSMADSVEDLLQALLAGPQDYTLMRILPRTATVRAVHGLRNGLVVNLGGAPQASDERTIEAPRNRLQWIERNIRQNFPFIDSIQFLINGEEAILK